MTTDDFRAAGRLVAIRRYPVKSMLGEELDSAEVTARGVAGDRAFALIEEETGKVVSAKNPRRWPDLFQYRSAYIDPSTPAGSDPEVRITFPGGDAARTDDRDIEPRLSAALGRKVRLARAAVEGASAEGYWPDHDWLPEPDTTFTFPLPPGTFFDGASIHLVTTATLRRLGELEPRSEFDVRRFRPNFIIEPASGASGFVEDDWIGRTLKLGEVELRIDGPCPRCIMTTLAQPDLPKDPAVLRTAVQQNGGNVGVYASVIRPGRVKVGDALSLS